eukprot:9705962-Ditylum_brightwellii.AAC.1
MLESAHCIGASCGFYQELWLGDSLAVKSFHGEETFIGGKFRLELGCIWNGVGMNHCYFCALEWLSCVI